MYKDASYKEKYTALAAWIPLIVEDIKKDLKNDHLKKDLQFAKKYLSNKNLNKTTTEELTEAYKRAIKEEENGEDIAEFMTSRWLIQKTDVYDFFERQLSQLNQDFTTLTELDQALSQKIMTDSIQQFGAPTTYLFAVLNSVVFPKEIFQRLEQHAKEETTRKHEAASAKQEQATLENAQRTYEREIARLTDKYEKKLSGLQKKYVTDVENLKKQVATLQRKLNA